MKNFSALVLCAPLILSISSCSGVGAALKPFPDEIVKKDAAQSKGDASQFESVATNIIGSPTFPSAPAPSKQTDAKVTFNRESAAANSIKEAQTNADFQVEKPKGKLFSFPKIKLPSINLSGIGDDSKRNAIAEANYQAELNAQKTAYVSNAIAGKDGYIYRLGSGDKVRIIVFGEESLSGEFYVNGEGLMSLPLIGEVRASGLTVSQLQDSITNTLSNGYLRSPRVSAEVLNFRPFYILGEVQKPGMYPYSSGLVIENAVAMGGGFTYRADKRKYYIKHENSSVEVAVPAGGLVIVQPGDTIRVSERYF